MAKLWFKSKTILFNLAAIAAVALQVGIFGELIPLEYEATALAVANLALRYLTSQGISSPSSMDILDAADSVNNLIGTFKKFVLHR